MQASESRAYERTGLISGAEEACLFVGLESSVESWCVPRSAQEGRKPR